MPVPMLDPCGCESKSPASSEFFLNVSFGLDSQKMAPRPSHHFHAHHRRQKSVRLNVMLIRSWADLWPPVIALLVSKKQLGVVT